jgi:hypothetical protein
VEGGLTWGDYNSDGYPDLLQTGESQSGYISKIYANNQAGFSEGPRFQPSYRGKGVFGDFNNDGPQDLAITASGDFRFTDVWKNTADGSFSQVENPGTSINSDPGVCAADFDNDGHLDLALAGHTFGGGNSEVEKGDGTGYFAVARILDGSFNTSEVACGDFDGDGDADILIAGDDQTLGPSTTLYLNNGGFNFSEKAGTGLPRMKSGAALAIGDYDNDGKLDVALTGDLGSTGEHFTGVYHNGGFAANPVFTQLAFSFEPMAYGDIAFADYNRDGRLDLFVTGTRKFDGVPTTKVYRNNTATANAKPSTPGSLIVRSSGGNGAVNLTLSWNKSIDSKTPQKSLTYNVGTKDTRWPALAAPELSLGNGKRMVVGPGNAGHRTSYKLNEVWPNEPYTWKVQAVDGAWDGSSFASSNFRASGNVAESYKISPAAPATVNLTNEGKLDWAHWGLSGATSFNHKNGVTQQIGNFTKWGTGTARRLSGYTTPFTWTDGKSTATATDSKTCVFVQGVNNGFQIAVPATSTYRTLRIYAGLYNGRGQFEAGVDDQGADWVSESLVDGYAANGRVNVVYTLTFKSATTTPAVLHLRWFLRSDYGGGDVALEAATLQ